MSQVCRVLLADDQPEVLARFRNLLRSAGHGWEVSFAGTGEEALDLLASRPYDVVVADLNMLGADGTQLLQSVMARHPSTVRIALSNEDKGKEVLAAIGPAHQHLPKSCDLKTLMAVLRRAHDLRDLLDNRVLRQVVSQMIMLPTLPSLYYEILSAMRSPNVSTFRIGQIISRDVGMSAKILQLVNSAFFGLREHVSSPSHAAALVGLEAVKVLVLSIHVFSQFEQARFIGLSLKALWRHSTRVSAFARRIAQMERPGAKLIDEALMGGLLHDVGKLVLAANFPREYRSAVSLANGNCYTDQIEAERAVFSATHAEVGAYLLGLWGLPEPIVLATAHHHSPVDHPDKVFTPLTAVYVANILEHNSRSPRMRRGMPEVDSAYLEKLGLLDRLSIWREECLKIELGDLSL